MTAPRLVVPAAATRDAREVGRLGAAVVGACRRLRKPVLASSVMTGPGCVLGARQRRERFAGVERLVRRRSLGREAHLQRGALHHALALPAFDALVSDARAENFLNRYVRGFLAGYRKLGVRADYLGRDEVRIDKQLTGRLGYDVEPDGIVLVELLAESTSDEPLADAERLADGFAAKFGVTRERGTLSLETDAAPPEPPALVTAAVGVPIGLVEAVVQRGPPLAVWLGGDLLASRAALEAVARAAEAALLAGGSIDARVLEPLIGSPLDGARPADLLAVLEDAARRSQA